MQFTEEKKDKYIYKVEDAFGTIEIRSPDRLVAEDGDAELLDDVFMAIYTTHKDSGAKKAESTIKDTEISYTFEKRQQVWDDVLDDEAKEYLSEQLKRPFKLIPKKKIHLFSVWYGECGYKLSDNFKNKIQDYVKKNKQN